MNAKLEARRLWRGAVRMSEAHGMRVPIFNEVMGATTLLFLAGVPPFWVFLLATALPRVQGRFSGSVILALVWLAVFSCVRMYGREEDAPGGTLYTPR
jgi:hypothetical protein